MSQESIALRYIVSGMVQGVGYRMFVVQAAARAGVAGYVRNQRDGRVEVYAIGSPEQLAQLRGELERGPRFASVGSVSEQPAPLDSRYTDGFAVEPTA